MSAARTKGYIILLEGMREIERILRERMHEDEATIKECGVPLLVESMADQIDELKAQLEATPPAAHAEAGEWDRPCKCARCGESFGHRMDYHYALGENEHCPGELIPVERRTRPAPADALREDHL